MATALFDIEADGLHPTKIHCVCVAKAERDTVVEEFRPHQIRDAVAYLEEFDTVVAHHGIVYDVPVMKRLAGFKPKRVRDSLVLSRMLFGNLKEALDDRLYARTKAHKTKRAAEEAARSAEITTAMERALEEGEAVNENLPPPLPPDDFVGFPGNMRGRHGIEAWGMRFGMYKGDYAKQMISKGLDPWADFNEDMLSYCAGDVRILHKLWMDLIRPRLLGYVAPFNVEVEIIETFKRLDARETNKREFKLYVDVPAKHFSSDEPFEVGKLIRAAIESSPSSLPAHADPAIQAITVRDFPGYCTIDPIRPKDDPSRNFISVGAPRYLDRATLIENEKKTAKDFDINIASALLGQSKNRMIELKKLNNTNVRSSPHSTITKHFIGALDGIKLYGHGTVAGRAVEIEHYMAEAMAMLEDSGIHIDQEALDVLVADLKATEAALEKNITDYFKPRYEPTKWVLRTFGAGPADVNTRRMSKFPFNRIAFPGQNMYAPQRNLPEGYVREYWGAAQTSSEYRRAKGKAEKLGLEFVDTRDCVRSDDTENTIDVFDGDRTPIKLKAVNPRSRQQLARRLMEEGWVPESFTDKGGPALDDTELKKLATREVNPMPIAETIRMYLLVQKRLGQIVNGRQAWKKLVRPDGRIHPHINPCGAVTARATHSDPNVSQVPTVVRVKDLTPEDPKRTRLAFGREGEWGADCRRIFTVPNTYKITRETHPELFDAKGHVSVDALRAFDPTYCLVVGADLAGIELRMLAHYLAPYDGGKFMNTLLNEDVHETNRVILQFANREDAKRFLFALLYGAGDEKLGSIYNPTGTIAEQKAAGRVFRERLMAGIVGFKELVNDLRANAREGNIMALDGRLIPIRSPHAALNTLLQSGGALVSKYWIKEVNKRFQEELGLVYDRDYSKHNGYTMLLWSHDEIQNSGRAKYAAQMSNILMQAAAATEQILGLSIPIKADSKIGLNWLETH